MKARHFHMPAAEYHADRKRLSGSVLEKFIERPSQMQDWLLGTLKDEPTTPMIFGSLFHAMVFEPETVEDRFAFEPEDPERPGKSIRRSRNDYKAWLAEAKAADLEVLPPDAKTTVGPMVDRIAAEPEIATLLRHPDAHLEQVVHWDHSETGRHMRARLDELVLGDDTIVELKTGQVDPDDERNRWRWYRLGYHRKAYLYLDALRALTGRNGRIVHVFIESEAKRPRLFVTESFVDSPAVQLGEMEVLDALERLAAHEKANDWRNQWEAGAPGNVRGPLPLPAAKLREIEFDGLTGATEVAGNG